jgi:hypothetical protein
VYRGDNIKRIEYEVKKEYEKKIKEYEALLSSKRILNCFLFRGFIAAAFC